jgi:CRISPR-associated endonuclease Csn1
MPGYTLGLDLGSNSIGWALVDEAGHRLLDAGVRVFPEGVDAFDTSKEKSRTQERRMKRGMRRQIARRARRKRALCKLLQSHGLLPTDGTALASLIQQNPYALRAKGLDHQLTLHEMGRVLLHLNARRGFLSNSKSDKAKEKETSEMLQEISTLAKEIADAGHRTLGEHFASQVAQPGEVPKMRVRGRHTRRDMLRNEFEMLWDAQRAHHPSILTDELKRALNNPSGDASWWMGGAIFGQRHLYWPASMIGYCELEPKERRCLKADRIAQRYRLLSEINNLKYIDPDTGAVSGLDTMQRTLLLDHLSRRKELTFDQVRKLLGMLETVQFNLEKGERAKLKGHVVDYIMSKESAFGGDWWEMSEARKNEIVSLLADPRTSDESVIEAAVSRWELDRDTAETLLRIQFPAGYMSLSRKAIEKLLPFMEQGMLYMTDDQTPCALTKAGYLREDQKPRKTLSELPEPPDLPNPVVRQALHELRRVVNAIVREYGTPTRIHVELARNIKMGPDARSKYNKSRREREDARAAAADALRQEAPGTRLSRDLIDKFLLWKEQNGQCVYTGKNISLKQLLAGEVDVDHIFPRWRSLDDSFGNKVVCLRDANLEKGDRTPFEWLGGNPDRMEALKQAVRHLPWRKRARFTQETLNTDEFSARQLVDTAYITRAAVDYLRCLVAEPHHVLGGKGTYTAELRHLWGLETVLSELPDSPAWAAQIDLRPGEKNRADHRHHALDAIVVALTDQRRLQALSRLYKNGQSGAEILPWEQFRGAVKTRLETMKVSHRVQRRVSGSLHEETIYGRTQTAGAFVVRKPVESLTPSMVEDIRDPTIRQLIVDRLAQHGVKIGRKTSGTIPKEAWKEPLLMPSGVPVKKVRLIKRDETIRPLRGGNDPAHVKPGSTHHLCIFEYTQNQKTKREAVFVTTLEAMERIKKRKPIIQRIHPRRADAQFVMSLSAGELVLGMFKGKERLVKYKTAASTQGQIYFIEHAEARRDTGENVATRFAVTANTLNGRKVTVDPLGRVRWAND